MNGAIARSASAVVAAHLATRAAMRQERVTQGNPRPVQPDGQRPTVQTEIGGDVGPVFAVEIDFADQIGINVPQFAQKAANAGAEFHVDYALVLRVLAGILLECIRRPVATPFLSKVIIEHRTQHGVEPGIHPFGVTKLAAPFENPQEERLKDVFSIGTVTEASCQEPEKSLAVRHDHLGGVRM